MSLKLEASVGHALGQRWKGCMELSTMARLHYFCDKSGKNFLSKQ
jgi:hypothetical protein